MESTRYYCRWCWWAGRDIGEQASVEPAGIRYVCYLCGNEVQPGSWPARRRAPGTRTDVDEV